MMKNYQYYQNKHKYILKSFMVTVTLLLLVGISISPISWEHNPKSMAFQVILITGIILSLLFYAKKESNTYKTIFIFLITLYFYAKFWTFPETAIMLAIFAIAPLVPIFLADKLGFYIIASLNMIFGFSFIFVISNTNLRNTYEYVAMDPLGNALNFFAIQIILVFVFLGTNNRLLSTKASQKDILQAEQLNSIGQLAATIAHEIRNPITVVKGFAQLLEQDKELSEKEKFYVQTMLTELEYTQVIINDYLSLAKPQAEHIQVLSVNHEISKIAELLTSFANNHNVGIVLKLNGELKIKMDMTDFKQLLVNIIKNGIESMTKAGFIMIETGQEKNMATIKITDTGIGMTKQQVTQLGTPFFSLKERGTGIGLSLCYTTVHKYEGEIKVDSQLNKGTTFTLYLPLHQE